MATLVSLGDQSIGLLIRALVNPNEEVCRRTSLALVTIGEPAVDPLIRAIADQDPGIRRGVIEVLGQIGNTKAIAPTIGALDDPERLVRIEAVRALAALGVPAIAPLMQVFREGDIRMKSSAMEALWMLGQPATTPLIMVLRDDQVDVRKRAALLLGEIGDQKAVDHITGLLADDNVAVRREAFEALEMIKKRNTP
jgi:HEAT repeat protein